jgi:hypothetical protein
VFLSSVYAQEKNNEIIFGGQTEISKGSALFQYGRRINENFYARQVTQYGFNKHDDYSYDFTALSIGAYAQMRIGNDDNYIYAPCDFGWYKERKGIYSSDGIFSKIGLGYKYTNESFLLNIEINKCFSNIMEIQSVYGYDIKLSNNNWGLMAGFGLSF